MPRFLNYDSTNGDSWGVQMKKLFLGSVALVALGLGAPAAFAAERPVPAPAYAPPPPAPVYTWTGCYAGANAGYSAGRSTHTTVANSIVTGGPLGVPPPALLGAPAGTSIAGDLNLSGFIGGFQGGGNASFISQTQERWLVTARGKLGMTWWDKSMVYVTGGAAWAKIDVSEFQVGGFGTGHQESNTRTGWTVGAGYEYALGYGWSIKGEYLYVKFDDYQTFTQPPFGGAGSNIAPRNNKLYDNIFRAGMNYKIGWY